MSHQESNYEKPEEVLSPLSTPFEIPTGIRWVLTLVFALIVLACIAIVVAYVQCPESAAAPKDIGLAPIFLFSVSALIVLWIPWQRLGIRITKIGGIEFEKIVAEQASEHAEELTYLQDRIEVLEGYVRKIDDTAGLTEAVAEPELRKLLLEFLNKYSSWAFSPSRIRAWGAKQQGFSELSNYDYQFIRSTLQKLVTENELETRISKKGNTLYRAPLP